LLGGVWKAADQLGIDRRRWDHLIHTARERLGPEAYGDTAIQYNNASSTTFANIKSLIAEATQTIDA